MSSATKLASDVGEFIRSEKLSDRVNQQVINLSSTDFYEFSPEFYTLLEEQPLDLIPELQKQLKILFSKEIELLFSDELLPSAKRTPHELKAQDFAEFLSILGVVRRAEAPEPVVSRLAIADEQMQINLEEYSNQLTSLQDSGFQFYFNSEQNGDRLYGLSTYSKLEKVYLQDAPENLSFTLPTSIQIVLQDELVDRIRPGDRISATGIYLPAPHQTLATGKTVITRGYLLAFGLQTDEKLIKEPKYETETQKMLSVLKSNALQYLSYSFAPSIFGLKTVKKALILQLLKGVERENQSSRVRADINVYLVGSAGCGKSQLLKFAEQISQISTASTGRGASAVGLTAGVIENEVEAGAMVLADGGLCCVDEFDKLLEVDRSAIHEALEQQKVSIHKANAHLELNARCAVLAAGNLAYGEWNEEATQSENLNMPESLISRFDLIFKIEDSRSKDLEKAHQVFENRFLKNEKESDLSQIKGQKNELFAEVPLSCFIEFQDAFEHDYNQLKQKLETGTAKLKKERFLLTKGFLKEIIAEVELKQPILTESAAKLVAELYAEMRLNSIEKQVLVTARALESMIRLATACAKLNSDETDGYVTESNVEQAYYILRESLFEETEMEAKKALTSVKNSDGAKSYILEIFTEYCLEEEESFKVKEFESHCMKVLREIGIPCTKEEFERMFEEVQKEVQGVYVEDGVVYM